MEQELGEGEKRGEEEEYGCCKGGEVGGWTVSVLGLGV